jgi:putative methionine-R-sulfoxide reductase with GAF domain
VQTVFERGRPDGDFVFGLLEKDQPYFCEDVRTQPPPGWDASRDRDYRTFISVPARVGGRSMGMVTADAPEVGDLNEQNEALLRVFGTVIAASMMLTEDED